MTFTATDTTTDTTRGKTSSKGNGLAANLRHLVDEADHFLQSTVDGGDEKIDAMRLKLAHQVRELRAQLDEMEDSAMHKARHAARATDQAVHSHPYGAMGIAAAVGLLVGFLAARR